MGKLNFNKVFTEFRKDIEICSIAKTVQALSSSKRSPKKPGDTSTMNTSGDERVVVAFGTRESSGIRDRPQ